MTHESGDPGGAPSDNEPSATVHFLDDLVPGQRFAGAAEFDPQPFHLDENAAAKSLFGSIAASGWHTAAVTMRLLVDSEFTPAGGVVGAGFEELRWPRPVRPGDELHVEVEVLEVRPSNTRPEQGMAKIRTVTLNQHDEIVQLSVGNIVVRRRPR